MFRNHTSSTHKTSQTQEIKVLSLTRVVATNNLLCPTITARIQTTMVEPPRNSILITILRPHNTKTLQVNLLTNKGATPITITEQEMRKNLATNNRNKLSMVKKRILGVAAVISMLKKKNLLTATRKKKNRRNYYRCMKTQAMMKTKTPKEMLENA